jgi:AmmeMemoRadiSam system protein A
MEKDLIQLCFDSINEVFTGLKIDREGLIKKYPSLLEKRASFVTINKNNQLRGCIGSIIPTKPLIDDIIQNAKSSAFRDSRFNILSLSEFEDISISLSILTIPKELYYKDIDDLKSKIKIGVHGVILKLGSNQSTFLPSVWEQLPSFDIFFSHLCQKAGCANDCLSLRPNIYTYETKYIK